MLAFTIISENYLPQAKTLAENFEVFHPEMTFYIFLFKTEASQEIDPFFTNLKIIEIDKNIGEYNELRNRYDNFSLACALKPYASEYLFNNFDTQGLIYLDADLYFFSEMTTVLELLSAEGEKDSIILTPHNININQNDYEIDRNIAFLNYGVFNAGFFAIKNTDSGKSFIKWWKRMLRFHCKNEPNKGLYCDQTWLDLVPVLFSENLHILKDPGYNIGFWNVDSERHLTLRDSTYLVNNDFKLVFYHFARFQLNKNILDKLYFTDNDQRSIVEKLYETYSETLVNNKFSEFRKDIEVADVKKKVSMFNNIKETVKWKLIRILQTI